MEDEPNPFASPASDLTAPQAGFPDVAAAAPRGNAWRHGALLIVARTVDLPDRCIKCNAPASFRLRRTYYWHHPAIYITIFAGLLIYVILALVLRKSANVGVGLCPPCRDKRQRSIWIGLFVMLASVVMVLVTAMYLSKLSDLFYLVIPVSFLVFLCAALFLNNALYVLTATLIDERVARFERAGPAFLDTLPAWVGR
jgi:hypothetical protein